MSIIKKSKLIVKKRYKSNLNLEFTSFLSASIPNFYPYLYDFLASNKICERQTLCNQPPLRKAIKSERSLALPIPAKAMALPGAKPEGDFSHLSRLPSVHFKVALAARADE